MQNDSRYQQLVALHNRHQNMASSQHGGPQSMSHQQQGMMPPNQQGYPGGGGMQQGGPPGGMQQGGWHSVPPSTLSLACSILSLDFSRVCQHPVSI